MACSECESGKFGCECCCASVTNIKGGIHPDVMQSVSRDLVLDETTAGLTKTHNSYVLLDEPVHIIGVNASLISVRRDETELNQDKQLQQPATFQDGNIARATPASVSLFTTSGFSSATLGLGGFNAPEAQESDRDYFCTASLTSGTPTYDSPDDLYGYFCDAATFVEFNAPTPGYGIRLIVRYVPRLQFSPAYHDPLEVMQHYWKCSRGDAEFLDGFYGGTSADIPSTQTGGTATRSIPTGTTGGASWSTSLTTVSTWWSFD